MTIGRQCALGWIEEAGKEIYLRTNSIQVELDTMTGLNPLTRVYTSAVMADQLNKAAVAGRSYQKDVRHRSVQDISKICSTTKTNRCVTASQTVIVFRFNLSQLTIQSTY